MQCPLCLKVSQELILTVKVEIKVIHAHIANEEYAFLLLLFGKHVMLLNLNLILILYMFCIKPLS